MKRKDKNGTEEGQKWKISPGAAEGTTYIPSGQRQPFDPTGAQNMMWLEEITSELLYWRWNPVKQHQIYRKMFPSVCSTKGSTPRHRLLGRRMFVAARIFSISQISG